MVSFGKFLLKYFDDWNIEMVVLAEELGVNIATLGGWIYRGRIPIDDNIEVLEEYFEDEFKDIQFDGKKFKRKFKVIRPDGSSQVYDTILGASKAEGMFNTTITRCLREDEAVKIGNYKGYYFERLYTEVD